ncbi:MAG: putative zinc-binding metallopeptidase [Pseudomonadales bacterium]|jgi:hypothetical protein|nr:putative zinc-binding metallopeptidase [Pseudomonadales bacterium]
MRRFECPCCGARLYFENSRCLECDTDVGFSPERLAMLALREGRACAQRTGAALCNWMLEDAAPGPLCASCALTRTLPDLSAPGAAERYRVVEQDKRRLCFTLLRAGLGEAMRELRFDVLADPVAVAGGMPSVSTGHLDGLVTLSLAEADPGYRERMRMQLAESYRTVLGHLRHESGHFFFPRLVAAHGDRLARFRALFGDEREDYEAALQAHHAGVHRGDPSAHVSDYASAHPHEDWAETWAHLLHILDTLESARSLGLDAGDGPIDDPWDCPDIKRLLAQFAPVVEALNELNRALGHADAYPFAPGPGAIDKLAFAHGVLPVVSGGLPS